MQPTVSGTDMLLQVLIDLALRGDSPADAAQCEIVR